MSASDEEDRQYNDEEEEEDQDFEQGDDDDEEEDNEDDEDEETEHSGVRVAKNDDVDDEEDEADEDDEYDADEFPEYSAMTNRASELIGQGQTNDAIQVLKLLTQDLVDKLPETADFSAEKSDIFRSRVLSAFVLWIEIMRDGKSNLSSSLADHLTTWQTAFLDDPNLGLVPASSESDEYNEDEDDGDGEAKALVKEFSDLLDDIKQPSKKKQRS